MWLQLNDKFSLWVNAFTNEEMYRKLLRDLMKVDPVRILWDSNIYNKSLHVEKFYDAQTLVSILW